MSSITWLHLSDLHMCSPTTGWDADLVLRKLSLDLKCLKENHRLKPDLIFFTGDVAFGNIGVGPGKTMKDQFREAHLFLDRLRKVYRPAIPRNRVFLVPGNHDVNRHKIHESLTSWLDNQNNQDKIYSLIRDGGFQWQPYMKRLSDYKNFLHDGYTHLLSDPERLIYAAKCTINGVKVGIAGLNSAWSSGRDKEKGKLWVGGRWQISTLASKLKEVDLKVALMHHPISGWFNEHEEPDLAIDIEREFEFFLHGHEHVQWIDAKASGHHRIAAGACYDRSDRDNVYSFVRLNLDRQEGEAWLRTYDRRGGGWIPFVIHNRTDNNGVFVLKKFFKTWAHGAFEVKWPQNLSQKQSISPLILDDPRTLNSEHKLSKEPAPNQEQTDQSAAVCYKRKKSSLEFLLVRTSGGRWMFPKGFPNRDELLTTAAERIARQEAGVSGRVHPKLLTCFKHKKAIGPVVTVAAFLLEVKRRDKPKERHRTPEWFPPEDAAQKLMEGRSFIESWELFGVLHHAIARIVGTGL